MSRTAPHFLLITETQSQGQRAVDGWWRFVLEEIDGSQRIEAEDVEPQTSGERLELLTVVRGLEALDQPSRVTLITSSRFVGVGLRRGIEQWRENDWCWERFGLMTPINHADLWKRIDRALRFHQVECRIWNLERLVESAMQQVHPQLPMARSHQPGGRSRGRRWQLAGQWCLELARRAAAQWADPGRQHVVGHAH